MEIWYELCFNGEAVDNIVFNSEEEAKECLARHNLNFHEQNNDLVEWWLSMGFEDNPIVTFRRSN